MSKPDAPDDQTRHSAPPRTASETVRDAATGAWAPGTSSAFQPGTPMKIGRFEIREILGEGAFGRVYRAFDPKLEREVAIKVPHADGLTPTFRDRFLREARATATIHHPNVCPIYEYGTDGDLPFTVMRYVAGTTLDALLSRLHGALPVRHAVAIARKLALGVAAAHAQGVIHRDLKPQNVLYDKASRQVLITDFGLARITTQARMTADGAVFGTPAYMSPEQARGKMDEIGPASDVYSLGVILYRMLTGEVPFKGTVYEILLHVWETQPQPPSKLRPGLDPKLDAICLKVMAKKPADRYRSAKEFAAVLADYLRADGSGEALDTQEGLETQAAPEMLELDPEPEPGPLPTAKPSPAKPPAAPPVAEVPKAPRPALAPPARKPPDSAKHKAAPPPAPAARATPAAQPRKLVAAPAPKREDARPVPPAAGSARRKSWAIAGAMLLVAGLCIALGLVYGPSKTSEKAGPPPDDTNRPKPPDPPPDRFADHKFDQIAERRAAEWAIAKWGRVGVSAPGEPAVATVTSAEALREPFVVREITDLFVPQDVTDNNIKDKLTGLTGPLVIRFQVTGGNLGDESMQVFARIPKLETLVLYRAPRVTDAGVAALAEHPALKVLALETTAVTRPALTATLKTLPALTSLTLFNMAVTDDWFADLKGLTNLEEVSLVSGIGDGARPSQLTRAGLQHLAALGKLTLLNLGGHPVADDWLPVLHPLPLKKLYVVNTKVTAKGVEELRKAMPNCEVQAGTP